MRLASGGDASKHIHTFTHTLEEKAQNQIWITHTLAGIHKHPRKTQAKWSSGFDQNDFILLRKNSPFAIPANTHSNRKVCKALSPHDHKSKQPHHSHWISIVAMSIPECEWWMWLCARCALSGWSQEKHIKSDGIWITKGMTFSTKTKLNAPLVCLCVLVLVWI